MKWVDIYEIGCNKDFDVGNYKIGCNLNISKTLFEIDNYQMGCNKRRKAFFGNRNWSSPLYSFVGFSSSNNTAQLTTQTLLESYLKLATIMIFDHFYHHISTFFVLNLHFFFKSRGNILKEFHNDSLYFLLFYGEKNVFFSIDDHSKYGKSQKLSHVQLVVQRIPLTFTKA